MPNKKKIILLLILVVLLIGCTRANQSEAPTSYPRIEANDHHDTTYQHRVAALQKDLAALNHQTDWIESERVAETAIGYSSYLAEEYELVRPAILHNVLIRLGLKDRGLCYHWTEDLINRLQELNLKSYQLHWGVAHQGSELREHNSVVITARGQAFEKGMVLDPWRNSGDLYWALIKFDRYPWKELPPEKW